MTHSLTLTCRPQDTQWRQLKDAVDAQYSLSHAPAKRDRAAYTQFIDSMQRRKEALNCQYLEMVDRQLQEWNRVRSGDVEICANAEVMLSDVQRIAAEETKALKAEEEVLAAELKALEGQVLASRAEVEAQQLQSSEKIEELTGLIAHKKMAVEENIRVVYDMIWETQRLLEECTEHHTQVMVVQKSMAGPTKSEDSQRVETAYEKSRQQLQTLQQSIQALQITEATITNTAKALQSQFSERGNMGRSCEEQLLKRWSEVYSEQASMHLKLVAAATRYINDKQSKLDQLELERSHKDTLLMDDNEVSGCVLAEDLRDLDTKIEELQSMIHLKTQFIENVTAKCAKSKKQSEHAILRCQELGIPTPAEPAEIDVDSCSAQTFWSLRYSPRSNDDLFDDMSLRSARSARSDSIYTQDSVVMSILQQREEEICALKEQLAQVQGDLGSLKHLVRHLPQPRPESVPMPDMPCELTASNSDVANEVGVQVETTSTSRSLVEWPINSHGQEDEVVMPPNSLEDPSLVAMAARLTQAALCQEDPLSIHGPSRVEPPHGFPPECTDRTEEKGRAFLDALGMAPGTPSTGGVDAATSTPASPFFAGPDLPSPSLSRQGHTPTTGEYCTPTTRAYSPTKSGISLASPNPPAISSDPSPLPWPLLCAYLPLSRCPLGNRGHGGFLGPMVFGFW